ncbi:hypothetical protein [Aridibaculum aurantiacum]|uniref:hypothetical protein n=1 Tax=Aridibaculum aurantiacum TaxID=2810307 RepID=UPI001A95B393|nr:hypothetical protein [Aridibaculum aurantiacum]
MATKSDNKTNTTGISTEFENVDLLMAPKNKSLLGEEQEIDVLDDPAFEFLNAIKNAKSADEEEDDDDVAEEEADEWEKPEEDDDWDPDFDEFDLPKSGKKAGGKKSADDDEDFKIDDEFKDLFAGSSSDFDDEDDDF